MAIRTGRLRRVVGPILAGSLLVSCQSQVTAAKTEMMCFEAGKKDETRLVVTNDGHGITQFRLVTPHFYWTKEGGRETARYPKNQRPTSPNLAGEKGFSIEVIRDTSGVIRVIDFRSESPDSVELEGLRGSLALHMPWLVSRATGSLFYTYSGNKEHLITVECQIK